MSSAWKKSLWAGVAFAVTGGLCAMTLRPFHDEATAHNNVIPQLPYFATAASFVVGTLLWRLAAAWKSIWRGLGRGLLIGLLAHPVCWFLMLTWHWPHPKALKPPRL